MVECFKESDKAHGRVETRSIELCRDLTWMMTADRWDGISYIVKMTRERLVLSTGKSSLETAYYVGSDVNIGAQGAATFIRRHWSIENELHWVLDMGFREDEARHRARHVAQNLATLRHFALSLIKREPTRKRGVANSRKRAGWDRNYLLHVVASERR